MNQLSFKELIATKPLESYTQQQIKNIKLLSLRKDLLADPFGSATYRIQKYPGDLDLHEIFIDCCSINEVIETFERKIKRIAKNIKKERLHYFSEFKAGLDTRYDINIGQISNGNYKPNNDLMKISIELFNKKLLNEKELKIISETLKKSDLGGDEYDIINYIFRERKILRWNLDEIIIGKKKLPGNFTMTLFNALHMKAHVKIDMITLIDDHIVEVTNFYILIEQDTEGQFNMINSEYDYLDPEQSQIQYDKQIRDEIEKLYYSNMYYSPFKMTKRMWAYSRTFEIEQTVRDLLPLVSGNISFLYQLSSELDTILRIVKLRKNPPIQTIKKQVDSMRFKAANILELDYQDLIKINEMIMEFMDNDNFELLENIKKYFKQVVNINTIKTLNKLGYNPPPKDFLPNQLKYAQIVREPYDIIHNPLDNTILGGSFFTDTFQYLENQYRKRYCHGRARPLLKGEIHPLCANFEGPGTRIDIPEVFNYPPYDHVDAAAKQHDFDYFLASKLPEHEKERAIRIADENFLREISKYPNEEPYYSIGKLGIQGKNAAENLAPQFVKYIAPNYFGSGCLTCGGHNCCRDFCNCNKGCHLGGWGQYTKQGPSYHLSLT